MKYAYHQITDFCNRITKAITVPFSNFAFVLHLFKGTNRIREMIREFLRPLLIQRDRTTIGIISIRAMPPLVQSYRLCS